MKLNKTCKPKKGYSLSWFPRRRWNILDLVQIIEPGSVPTYLFAEINMSFAEKLCADYLSSRGVKLTPTAILLKAIGIAQRQHPESRSALLPWGQTLIFERIVAGFTVEKIVDGQPAVYLGVIEDPDTKSLEEIAVELRAYGQEEIADVPQLALEERFNFMPWLVRRIVILICLVIPELRLRYMSASFGLTSIGKYGIHVLIPPSVSASTFGVGTIEAKPVVVDNEIKICPIMTLTLNFDHRLIDGAPAARFLSEIKKLMEGELANCLADATDIKAGLRNLSEKTDKLTTALSN
jgi:hypothetical protein